MSDERHRSFSPTQMGSVHNWVFATKDTIHDPLEVLIDLRSGISEYDDMPWKASFERKDVSSFSHTCIKKQMWWLCSSWNMPPNLTQRNERADKYVCPANNDYETYYADVPSEQASNWIRTAIRLGVGEHTILARLTAMDPTEDSIEEVCDHYGVALRAERENATDVLGRTFTYLRDGHHPTHYYRPSEHSIDEIAMAWNYPANIVEELIDVHESDAGLVSRLSNAAGTEHKV